MCRVVDWENHCFFIFLFFFGGSPLEVLVVDLSLFSGLDTGDLEPSSSLLPVEVSSVSCSFFTELSCCHSDSSSLKIDFDTKITHKYEMHFAASKQ